MLKQVYNDKEKPVFLIFRDLELLQLEKLTPQLQKTLRVFNRKNECFSSFFEIANQKGKYSFGFSYYYADSTKKADELEKNLKALIELHFPTKAFSVNVVRYIPRNAKIHYNFVTKSAYKFLVLKPLPMNNPFSFCFSLTEELKLNEFSFNRDKKAFEILNLAYCFRKEDKVGLLVQLDKKQTAQKVVEWIKKNPSCGQLLSEHDVKPSKK